MRRPGPRCTTLVLLSLIATSLGTGRAQAQDTPEPALFELRLGRTLTETVEGFRAGDAALVPVGRFLDLAGLDGRVIDGVATAVLHPRGIRVTVDATAGRILREGVAREVGPDGLLAADGEVYLATGHLAALFGIEIQVDWADLQVTLPDIRSLPIWQQRQREEARRAMMALSPEDAAQLPAVRYERTRWDGLVVDYSVQMAGFDPVRGAAYQLGAGADLFGGSFQVVGRTAGLAPPTSSDAGASWLRAWPTGRQVRQLRLGDGFATGPRARGVRGLTVGNAPYVRDQSLGEVVFGGATGPGWAIEAWSGGAMVAFDSADAFGRYAVDLPVRYGENPVELVAYGPHGEVHTFGRTYQAIQGLLPVGQFEYGLAGGACRETSCAWTSNLDLRYGGGRRWTVRGGLEASGRHGGSTLLQPYASLAATPVNPLAVELEGLASGFVRAAARFQSSPRLRLTLETASFAEGTDPILTASGLRRRSAATGFWRPDAENPLFYLEGAVEESELTSGRSGSARLGLSAQRGALRFAPYVRATHGRTTPGGGEGLSLGANGYLLPRTSAGPVLSGLWTRGQVELDGSGLRHLDLVVARNLVRSLRLETGVRWERGRTTGWSLGLTTTLPAVRAGAVMARRPGQAASSSQFLQGSLVWNRVVGELAARAVPGLERAGVTGAVFLDANANGRRDPGEQGVPHVRLVVGSQGVRTDSTGRYEAWQLLPFDEVVVRLDTLSVKHPLLVPTTPALRVVTAPNRFVSVDVPLVEGTVLDGAVELDGVPAGGLPLLIEDLDGNRRHRARSFRDGTFYMTGLVPGRWRLGLDPEAAPLGITAPPVEFEIAPADLAGGVAGVVLRAERAPVRP